VKIDSSIATVLTGGAFELDQASVRALAARVAGLHLRRKRPARLQTRWNRHKKRGDRSRPFRFPSRKDYMSTFTPTRK
jgi:hypothetical protein